MGPERQKEERTGAGHAAGTRTAGNWVEAALERAVAEARSDVVGVDLEAGSFHLSRVVRTRGTIAPVETASSTWAAGVGGEGMERALREVVSAHGLARKHAAGSIRGNEVAVRRLTLPAMKRADLLQALTLECRKHVPYPIEEAEIRYEVLPTAPAAGLVELLVAVAPRRLVQEAAARLEHAGLRPASLTIRPVALRALLHASGRAAPDQVVAYLDLGEAESHIMVFRGEEIRFSREFGMGASSLTDALRSIVVPGQGTIQLSHDEALALRREHGIPLGVDEGARAGSIPLAAVSIMLRPILERLVRELWNSFDYCNEQYQGEAVSRVVLLGRGAMVRNLPEYLAGVLKIPVDRTDLTRDVRGAGEGSGPRDAGPAVGSAFEVATGLGLLVRGSINFLEPAGAGVPYRLAEAVPQRIAAAAAAVLLLSMALPTEVGVVRERQRVAELKREVASIQAGVTAVREFRLARVEESRSRELAAQLSGGSLFWSDVLRDLSHRVGPGARLLSLEVIDPDAGGAAPIDPSAPPEGRTVRLSGLLRTDGQRPEQGLGVLMESLGRSPALGQVWLETCRSVAPGLSAFTLGAKLAG
jgi:type IV pilus assembly protein PilM